MGLGGGPGQGDPQGLFFGVVREGGGDARYGVPLAFVPAGLGDLVQFLPGQDAFVERFRQLLAGQDETLDPGQTDQPAQEVRIRQAVGLVADHRGQGAVNGAQAARIQRKEQGVRPSDVQPGGALGPAGGKGQSGMESAAVQASQLQRGQGVQALHLDGEADRLAGRKLSLAQSQPGFGREGGGGARNCRPAPHHLQRLLQHDRSFQSGDPQSDGEQVARPGRILQVGRDGPLLEVPRFGLSRRQFPPGLGAFHAGDALQTGALQQESLTFFSKIDLEREIGESRQRGMDLQGKNLRIGVSLGDFQSVEAGVEPVGVQCEGQLCLTSAGRPWRQQEGKRRAGLP